MSSAQREGDACRERAPIPVTVRPVERDAARSMRSVGGRDQSDKNSCEALHRVCSKAPRTRVLAQLAMAFWWLGAFAFAPLHESPTKSVYTSAPSCGGDGSLCKIGLPIDGDFSEYKPGTQACGCRAGRRGEADTTE